MPFIIDGHNLVPNIPGLSLDQLDDELALLELLAAYFKTERKKAVVYFDRGAPGREQNLQHGFVSARFTRPPLDADKAIRNDVRRLGKAAANYTVISSDHEVMDDARRKGARVISSAEFAKIITSGNQSNKGGTEAPVDNVDYWLNVFKGKS